MISQKKKLTVIRPFHVGLTISCQHLQLLNFTHSEPATAFFYFGMPRCCGGLYQICVDCDPNDPKFVDVDAVVPNDDGKNPPVRPHSRMLDSLVLAADYSLSQVLLFSQRFPTAGIHEVILRNQVDPRFGKSQITLDRFLLEIPDDTIQTKTQTVVQTTSIKTAGPCMSSIEFSLLALSFG